MAATIYGLGTWGITAQTGLYIQSMEYDFSVQEKYIPDTDGDDTAGSLYKPEATWSMNGFERTDAAVETSLAATIVLANMVTIADFVTGYTSGAITLITGAKLANAAEEFQSLDLSGKIKPFLSAAA